MKTSYLLMKYATIAFALIGLSCGAFMHHTLTISFGCLGVMVGAMVSAVAAGSCMIVNRINKLNVISLVLNLVLFIVIAREFQII